MEKSGKLIEEGQKQAICALTLASLYSSHIIYASRIFDESAGYPVQEAPAEVFCEYPLAVSRRPGCAGGRAGAVAAIGPLGPPVASGGRPCAKTEAEKIAKGSQGGFSAESTLDIRD